MSTATPRIIPLAQATEPSCGGKARGLARLIEHGLDVPPGFVIVDAHAGVDAHALALAYAELGAGKVAVRSSARAEDSDQASFAGQFESVLEVEGEAALTAALARCLASGERTRAYAAAVGVNAGGGQSRAQDGVGEEMSVVVQRMVKARCAGVLFTLDPVSGDESRWLIEAVAGLGEGLVSGHVRPDRYLLDPVSCEGPREPAGAEALLDDETLARLLDGARRARARFDRNLDLEWAIDVDGALYWLQARPVVDAQVLSLDRLDSPAPPDSPGFTRYNVGEILPGAITPLTQTTVIELIDQGFRRVYERLGVYGPRGSADAAQPNLAVFHGHLFMNLRGPYLFAAKVAGASKDAADRSLSGRVLDELDGFAKRGPLQRAWLGARMVTTLRRAPQDVAAVERRVAALLLTRAQVDALGPEALLARADALGAFGADVAAAHLLASTRSGMFTGILEGILGGGEALKPEHRVALASLLVGVGEVESAEIGVAVRALADALREAPGAPIHGDDAALLAWLEDPASGRGAELWAAFIERHGHRCVRELELRERDWAEEPAALLAALRAAVATTGASGGRGANGDAGPDIDAMPFSPGARRALRMLLPKIHEGIRLRERCKSIFVRVARLLAATYAALARQLVAANVLSDRDLVYFFTHAELGRLLASRTDEAQAMVQEASARRRVLPRQTALRMPMVSRAKPRPLPPTPAPVGARRLEGTPVSPGVVEGRARVVRSLSDAAALEPGEILIVPFTDAGWTPLFTVAAGLATEIGGTLSHGAVVARELGLPAIVDLPDATRTFVTGQRVRLDAERGVLEALERDENER